MSAHTILIIDDSEAIRAHVRDVLDGCQKHYQTLSAKDGLEGFKVMVSRPIDLVLCDVMMPSIDGFKLLQLKRTRPELQDVPVIMLTAADNVAQKVKALESGATDYLTKPFHDAELIARVGVHLDVRVLQRELRKKNRLLEELSNTDGLTKLTNRRHLMELAEIELIRAEEENYPLAVVLLDIDHFKQINDNHGHLTGDRTLCAVAEVLKTDLREQDIAARYGGEEFVLLLPKTNCEGAAAVAERYRKRIEALTIREPGRSFSLRANARTSSPGAGSNPSKARSAPVVPLGGLTREAVLQVTASFGVAAFPEQRADSIDELMQASDKALYRAKEQGRNRVCVADSSGHALDNPGISSAS